MSVFSPISHCLLVPNRRCDCGAEWCRLGDGCPICPNEPVVPVSVVLPSGRVLRRKLTIDELIED